MVKVPALDGTGKMSKSENELSTLYLSDEDEVIVKKVKKMQTDNGPVEKNEDKPAHINLIFDLMQLVSSKEVIEKYNADFNNAAIRYGDMKAQLAADMIAFISPIRQKAKDIMENEQYLKVVMQKGAAKATESASATMKIVRESMGLKYF